jgi:hypothetical protein
VAITVVPTTWAQQVVFTSYKYFRKKLLNFKICREKIYDNNKNKYLEFLHGIAPWNSYHGCTQWHRSKLVILKYVHITSTQRITNEKFLGLNF